MNYTHDEFYAMDKTRIQRRVKLMRKLLDQLDEMLKGTVAVRDTRSTGGGSSMDLVEKVLAGPGGMRRTQLQLVDATGLKPRTVAWAMNKLITREGSVAKFGTTYSLKGQEEHLATLTADGRTDALVLNEILWRFSPHGKHRDGTPYSSNLERFTQGQKPEMLASINRLVAANQLTLNAAGKITKPEPAKPLVVLAQDEGGLL